MTIHRTKHKKDYTVMANYHFKDKSMSLKAKGLLSLMLSLPDDWNFNFEGLLILSNDSKQSLRTTINELKKRGYLEITMLKPNQTENKKIQYEWNVYEKPIQYTEKRYTEIQYSDKQNTENQKSENQPQLNTNISNTKELNTYYSLDQKYSLSQDDFTEEEFEESMKRLEEGDY